MTGEHRKYTSAYSPEPRGRKYPDHGPYVNELGERVNRGRNYQSYLEEQYPHLSVKKIKERLKPDEI